VRNINDALTTSWAGAWRNRRMGNTMKIALYLVAAALAAVTSPADAAVNVYVSDNGTDSLVQVTGSLNLSGFTKISPNGTESGSDMLQGHNSILYTGSPRQGLQAYTGLTNNNVFGGFSTFFANSGTGTGFGINGAYTLPRLLLPISYTSGDAINSSATFLFKTIDSMALVRGAYVYSSSSDSITLHIGQAAPINSAVPEPATWGMMILGLGLVGGAMRRRIKVSEVSFTSKVHAIAAA
jgi:hypothetical protein